MNDPVVTLHHLSKSYGNVHAVQDLSLTIEAGSIFGFLGPNGAGKTTTMRMLCGLTHPTSGRATIWESNDPTPLPIPSPARKTAKMIASA